MSRIKLKKVDQISRKTVSDARDGFLRHCQLKNLAPHTYTYYKENLQFFFDSAPQVKFVDEFNQEVIENFIGQLMDKGNRVTAINARLRAAYVFLRYCFEQEYINSLSCCPSFLNRLDALISLLAIAALRFAAASWLSSAGNLTWSFACFCELLSGRQVRGGYVGYGNDC